MSRIDNPYVNHNHEITDGLGNSRKAFGVPLAGQWEYAIVLCRRHAIGPNDDLTGTLSRLDELETMHTAEHTDKNVCYRYASRPGKIYLFVGESIYPDHDVPKTLLTKARGGDKTILVVTLDHMKPLQNNVVLLSVALG
ncbi:hypothetical protein DS909_10760 [Phaeobacter gallaeciensis]|uniref:Uncharacterized protein n=2 Tax=Roseobacteraceae TaxID=2854170 RepID=A0A366X058_9RHOB|nr:MULTISPECIES: hypothetical protein [Roseobacteraceae]MBT3143468.1 hypothetical protein [Falsiruegeria litorea]MBT8167754.1 hypothetical protein [Falsiruegeria litorea]RBW55576.1 hypothetical protein DS909_10760 [Phaeobacter gallaeciensis]